MVGSVGAYAHSRDSSPLFIEVEEILNLHRFAAVSLPGGLDSPGNAPTVKSIRQS